jgi:hypothetical protein
MTHFKEILGSSLGFPKSKVLLTFSNPAQSSNRPAKSSLQSPRAGKMRVHALSSNIYIAQGQKSNIKLFFIIKYQFIIIINAELFQLNEINQDKHLL